MLHLLGVLQCRQILYSLHHWESPSVWLRTIQSYSFTVLKSRMCQKVVFFLEALEENPSLAFLASRRHLHSLAHGPTIHL